ncbi:MAG: ATP-binding cassette domain-containing protein [Candidatus Bathyarchaeia archaeon]
MVESTPLLSIKGLHKWFGKVHALNDINIDVFQGEVVGLLGDNGAGKSTLIKILAGVLQKDKGEIYWEGRKVEIKSVKEARKLGIETVFQERGLIENFSVSKNIFLGREPTTRFNLIDYKKMENESEKLMEKLRLRIKSHQEARFCSGGEKQGIIVSRAMYFKAKLVNLDEPTRALSIRGVEQVRSFVRELKKENIACIFVTHNFEHVYPVADRFIVMARGEAILNVEKREVPSLHALEELIINTIARV